MRPLRLTMSAALLLGSSVLALAQTAPTSTSTGNPATAPTVAPTTPAARNAGVNPSAAGMSTGSATTSGAAAPSTGTAVSPNGANASTAAPASTTAMDGGALKRGKNSFTQAQAKKRIERQGYSQVSELHKDDNSIWQANAMKSGQPVKVGLDYRGRVAEQK